jgi:hypothetical protein
MEMQRRVELISSPAREGSWQSVGLIASSVLSGVSTDSVASFEAVSGEEGGERRRAGLRADRPGRQL